MPFYSHNAACGDGQFETAVYESVQDAYQGFMNWVDFHDGFADQAEYQRNWALQQAAWEYQQGNYGLAQSYLNEANSQQWNIDYHRDAEADYAQAAAAAETDLELEEQDYDTEWAGWYAIGIQNGASHADAADCAHDCTVS